MILEVSSNLVNSVISDATEANLQGYVCGPVSAEN